MTNHNFFGLSLSDRLSQAGIADQFSNAVKSGNATNMLELLLQIDYSQDSAKATVETFLNNPDAFEH
ncbi:MAG: hypothetical protein OEX07_09260 [Gammaproteobacteria bacterium]|nr:hypothetical protein [Gammaproteobacteria bacterium]